MTTRTKIKREIDKLPNNLLDKVYKYINQLKHSKPPKAKLHTYSMKGTFDDIDIRERAYE